MKIIRTICLLWILFLIFLQIKLLAINESYHNYEVASMKTVLTAKMNIVETMGNKIKSKEEEIKSREKAINNLKKEIKKIKDKNLILRKKYSQLTFKQKNIRGKNRNNEEDREKEMYRVQSLKKKVKDIFSIVNQINLKDINKNKLKILKKVDDKIEKMKEEILDFVSKESAYKRELALKDKKIENISQKLKQSTEDKKKINGLVNEINDEKKKYALYKKNIQKNIINNNEVIRSFKKEKIKYQVKVAELSEAVNVLEKERDSFSEKFKGLVRKKDGWDKENALNKKDKGDVEKLIQTKDEKIKVLESDIFVWTEKYKKLNKEKESADKNIVGMEDLIARRADKILSLQENFEDKDGAILEAKNKINSQLKEIALLRKYLVKVKLENALFAEKISQFNDQIKQNFEKTSAILDSEIKELMTDDNKIKKQKQSRKNKEVNVEIMSAEITKSENVK